MNKHLSEMIRMRDLRIKDIQQRQKNMKLNKTRRFSVVYQLDTNKINNTDGRSTSRTI